MTAHRFDASSVYYLTEPSQVAIRVEAAEGVQWNLRVEQR